MTRLLNEFLPMLTALTFFAGFLVFVKYQYPEYRPDLIDVWIAYASAHIGFCIGGKLA